MGTVTVTSAGFASLPASPPANWPAYVTYPGAVAPNGTHIYTVSDADFLRLMTWTAATQMGAVPALPPPTPITPTVLQILLAWVQVLWKTTQAGEQLYSTTPPSVPPPITVS